MEFDAFQNYLEVLREQRKTPRERAIEKELAEIGLRHKRAMDAELAPLLDELTKIEIAKPPMPIFVDGKVFEYVGPGAVA